jgi:hypothetical protein
MPNVDRLNKIRATIMGRKNSISSAFGTTNIKEIFKLYCTDNQQKFEFSS